jgi:hypothetical protein
MIRIFSVERKFFPYPYQAVNPIPADQLPRKKMSIDFITPESKRQVNDESMILKFKTGHPANAGGRHGQDPGKPGSGSTIHVSAHLRILQVPRNGWV